MSQLKREKSTPIAIIITPVARAYRQVSPVIRKVKGTVGGLDPTVINGQAMQEVNATTVRASTAYSLVDERYLTDKV